MEDCFTTLWYANCTTCDHTSSCERNPGATSYTSSDVVLIILLILETVTILVLSPAIVILYRSKKRGELLLHENGETVYRV